LPARCGSIVKPAAVIESESSVLCLSSGAQSRPPQISLLVHNRGGIPLVRYHVVRGHTKIPDGSACWVCSPELIEALVDFIRPQNPARQTGEVRWLC
jgi:hypothetical protein